VFTGPGCLAVGRFASYCVSKHGFWLVRGKVRLGSTDLGRLLRPAVSDLLFYFRTTVHLPLCGTV
jgi:hypothetical protein